MKLPNNILEYKNLNVFPVDEKKIEVDFLIDISLII